MSKFELGQKVWHMADNRPMVVIEITGNQKQLIVCRYAAASKYGKDEFYEHELQERDDVGPPTIVVPESL